VDPLKEEGNQRGGGKEKRLVNVNEGRIGEFFPGNICEAYRPLCGGEPLHWGCAGVSVSAEGTLAINDLRGGGFKKKSNATQILEKNEKNKG